jgi:hypothetical protein
MEKVTYVFYFYSKKMSLSIYHHPMIPIIPSIHCIKRKEEPKPLINLILLLLL